MLKKVCSQFQTRTTHNTYIRGNNISLVLILLSTAVQIKDLTFEGALDFQMGLSRQKGVLFKEWVRNWKEDLPTKKKLQRIQETNTFYLEKETKW